MDLVSLKVEGHNLLEEYIAIDYHKGRSRKKSMQCAYEKLESKLPEGHNVHFAMMTTKEEILRAISCLRKMIKKRETKIKYMGLDKVEIASNVIELQKGINQNYLKIQNETN